MYSINLLMRCCLSNVNKRKSTLLVLGTLASIYFLSTNLSLHHDPVYEYTWKCGELLKRFPDSIPPLVHWTTKDGRVPDKLIPIVRSWKRLLDTRLNISNDRGNRTDFHSDRWHFMHWDDKQISELISKHYPHLTRSYSKLVNGLERSDIGRLVVLHHVGGLYVDTNVELLRDPTPMLRPSQLQGVGLSPNFSCQSAVWSQEPLEHPVFIFNISWMISNAVMMSRANHSFLSFVLKNWPPWFESNWSDKWTRTDDDAVHVTGPRMLQTFYNKYTALKASDRPDDWCGNMLAEADAFQPFSDWNYEPQMMRRICADTGKLEYLQRQYCQHAARENFKEKSIPKSSYTLHNFMHLSYFNRMNIFKTAALSHSLPILMCKI